LLQDHNDLVKGHAIVEDVATKLQKDPDFFTHFTHIIAANVGQNEVNQIAKIAWGKNIPFFIVESNGLVGYLRIQNPEHSIVESKMDNPFVDLRILETVDGHWPELLEYSNKIDYNSLDSTEHAHVPFLVILIKALQEWRKGHGGKKPINSSRKRRI